MMKLSFRSILALVGLGALFAATIKTGGVPYIRNLRCGGDIEPQTFADFPVVPGDLKIRFNKIPVLKSAPFGLLPLRVEDYPIRGDKGEQLKQHSKGASIVTAQDFELHQANAVEYINLIGGMPSMPNENSSHAFWDDFRHVVNVQLCRRNGTHPAKLTRFPDLWSKLDIHEVAEAVHDEYPGYHQSKLLEKLWSQGVEVDTDILPFRSVSDFIGLQVRLADLNTWAVGVVAPLNFCTKWFAGRPRPEEVAWKIATGELGPADGVPKDIWRNVRFLNLRHPNDFTAYPEGCPVHPSWPAMHSAASSASLWLAVVLKNMTSEQYCEALRVDYGVSYARTVAGVHYPTDNIAGLNLGKQVLLEQLPNHLATKYGSDPAAVQAKIDNLAFDWATFNPEDCSYST